MDTYDLVILLSLIGFFLVAFILLAPVYRFLEREEQASLHWTKEALAKRMQEKSPPPNGTPKEEERSDV